MLDFITKSGERWSFNDDVKISGTDGSYTFATASGVLLDVPNDLARFDAPAKTTAELLEAAKRSQIEALSRNCQRAIYAGFTSSALGSAYTYPATDTDQRNLIASVTASLLPNLPGTWTTPFWCADSTGAWAMRQHTAAQIQKAGLDGQAAITTLRLQNAKLAEQVMAATTVSAVQAIVWTNPA